MYQATQPAPAHALKFWQSLMNWDGGTPERSSIRGIERQIWHVAQSTDVDFRDLAQETFKLCAEKFAAYRKDKSALNTWVRWQARAAARNISRQGTKHSIVDGKQATVKMEENVSPFAFTAEEVGPEESAESGTSDFQGEIRKAVMATYSEEELDVNLVLETALSNGRTVRELATFLLEGQASGIRAAASAWDCTVAEVRNLILEARGLA